MHFFCTYCVYDDKITTHSHSGVRCVILTPFLLGKVGVRLLMPRPQRRLERQRGVR